MKKGSQLAAVLLAAGSGSRMRGSCRDKILEPSKQAGICI